jgi:hypothetical protein
LWSPEDVTFTATRNRSNSISLSAGRAITRHSAKAGRGEGWHSENTGNIPVPIQSSSGLAGGFPFNYAKHRRTASKERYSLLQYRYSTIQCYFGDPRSWPRPRGTCIETFHHYTRYDQQQRQNQYYIQNDRRTTQESSALTLLRNQRLCPSWPLDVFPAC